MKAAFYRGTHAKWYGLYNRLIRAFEGGPYSHCEIVFSNGDCASASAMDHGVRFCGDHFTRPRIDFYNGHWDLIPLPDHLENAARLWFLAHEGESYDLRGNVRFVWPWGNRDSKLKYFCSESVLASIGVPDAWRFGVNAAAAVCRRLGNVV